MTKENVKDNSSDFRERLVEDLMVIRHVVKHLLEQEIIKQYQLKERDIANPVYENAYKQLNEKLTLLNNLNILRD